MLKNRLQSRKERRFFFVLEYVELTDDVVALFAYADQLGEGGPAGTGAWIGLNRLRAHARKIQRVISDVLPDLPFGNKRRGTAVNVIRSPDHLLQLADRPALRVVQPQNIL